MTYEELRAEMAKHPELAAISDYDAVVAALRAKTVEVNGTPVPLLDALGWPNLCGGDIHWSRNPTEQPAGAINDEWWRTFGTAEAGYAAAKKIGETNHAAFEAKVKAGTIEARVSGDAVEAVPVVKADEPLGEAPPQ